MGRWFDLDLLVEVAQARVHRRTGLDNTRRRCLSTRTTSSVPTKDSKGVVHYPLYASSVMEYNSAPDRVFLTPGWAPYDQGAIARIYANNQKDPAHRATPRLLARTARRRPGSIRDYINAAPSYQFSVLGDDKVKIRRNNTPL